MSKRLFWHGSALPRPRLLSGNGGGVHIGTLAQALDRRPEFLHAVRFVRPPRKVLRAPDHGDAWAGAVAEARARGFDAISYLNRWEGLPKAKSDRDEEWFEGPVGPPNPEDTDALFLLRRPGAQRSLLVLDPDLLRVERIVPFRGWVKAVFPERGAEAHALAPGTRLYADARTCRSAHPDAEPVSVWAEVGALFEARRPVRPEEVCEGDGAFRIRNAVRLDPQTRRLVPAGLSSGPGRATLGAKLKEPPPCQTTPPTDPTETDFSWSARP